MNIGEQVVRLNHLVRKLNAESASSFASREDLYKLFTDIMLEANKGREITSERAGDVSDFHSFVSDIFNIHNGKERA